MDNAPVVIVSGASRGLGAAVTRWLAKVGAAIMLIARSGDKLGDVAADVRRLGGKSLVCEADVSDYDACRAAVNDTLTQYGRIDSLVNNAGVIQPISTIARTDPASWRYNIEVNPIGPFNLIRAAVADLRKQRGRIVNVSSGTFSK